MDDSADQLTPPQVDKSQETLKAFVAPVAHESDAVTKDPRALVMAQSVYAAFGNYGATGGLSRSQIASACASSVPREVFESRFDLLVSMGFLYRYANKAHQMHYAINPDGVTGLLVFGRATKAGGIEEIMLLLGHAREALRAGTITAEQLAAELNRARYGLAIYSGHLLHLTEARTWEELIAERARHRSANALVDLANDLVRITCSRFPGLSGSVSRLVDEALRYDYAVGVFMERLYKQASVRRDFSMLMPEQYRSAALQCTQEELAVPLARTVFDPASISVPAEELTLSLDLYRPPPARRRPPRPSPVPDTRDPIEEARRRERESRAAITAHVELLLDGAPAADVTIQIADASWRYTARTVTDSLSASSDPEIPVTARLSTELIIRPGGPVSHITPMALRRDSRPAPGIPAAPNDNGGALGDSLEEENHE